MNFSVLTFLLLLTVNIIIIILFPFTNAEESLIPTTSNTSISEGDHVTLPGCPNKCGNLTVPYPFGIGTNSGCSFNSFFDIKCNSSFDPLKAFLAYNDVEVLNIYDTKILLKSNVSYECYNESGFKILESIASMTFVGTPFWISSENMLNVVGCDDISLLSLDFQDYEDYDFVSSCVAICNKTRDLTNGSCAGIGCCQSAIPGGLQSIYVESDSLNDHVSVASFSPCGFAFVAEQNSYTFQVSDLLHNVSLDNRTLDPGPIVIDWAIGNMNCSEIGDVGGHIVCKGESVCVDYGLDLGGYRCKCSHGFAGNPYLSPGCQDIDECKYDPCNVKATCENLYGSYNCTCDSDYLGDGRKDGTGCLKLPPQKKAIISAGLLIGFGSFSVLLLSLWLCKALKKRKLKKRRETHFKRNGGLLLQQQTSGGDNHLMEKMKLFTAKELEKATDRFNECRILGKGGQGTVYKGMLPDGRIVAVKMSKKVDGNQLEEFINEVVILSQINHKNIVKLLGCCLETEVPLLVYEFISNGTLFDLIHDEGTNIPFSWDMRLRIAAEVANALMYLHYATSIPIYHRDMKTTNILLDEKYRAKLADFGISRSVSVDQTHLTTKVQGTFGYLDPEYFQTSKFTEKSDVYSFGVILVELLTGEKPISTNLIEEERSLVTRFLLTMENDSLKTILDSQIIEQGANEEHFAVATLARKCLNFKGRRRPNIREVAVELESIRICENPSSLVESNIEEVSDTENLELSHEAEYVGGGR